MDANCNKYAIDVSEPSSVMDYQTLGVDDNGVYIVVSMGPTQRNTVISIDKAYLLTNPVIVPPTVFPPAKMRKTTNVLTDSIGIQPAVNFDSVSSSGGTAWFVGYRNPSVDHIWLVKVTWDGASFSAPQWIDTPAPVTAWSGTQYAPQPGTSSTLSALINRFGNAVIRNNFLWTTRAVPCRASDGQSISTDRTGIEWLKFDLSQPTPTYTTGPRLWDNTASNPRWFYCRR